MWIYNAGNRIVNTWLYPVEDGYAMIDTGYENSYVSVVKNFGNCGFSRKKSDTFF